MPKIITKLTLSEISPVDHPAQAPALIAITKNLIKEGEPMSQADDKNEALEAKILELEKSNAKYEAIAGLSAIEKSYFDSLGKSDKDEYLSLNQAGRNELAKAFADESRLDAEVVYKSLDGTEYKKSDDPRLVTLAKQADISTKNAEIEKQARYEAEVRKKAGELIPNLGSTQETRFHLLKAVMSIEDETIREDALNTLSACDSKFSKAFDRMSVGWGIEDTVEKADEENPNSLLSVCRSM